METTAVQPFHPSETQADQAAAFAAYTPTEEGLHSTEAAYIAADQAYHSVVGNTSSFAGEEACLAYEAEAEEVRSAEVQK